MNHVQVDVVKMWAENFAEDYVKLWVENFDQGLSCQTIFHELGTLGLLLGDCSSQDLLEVWMGSYSGMNSCKPFVEGSFL